MKPEVIYRGNFASKRAHSRLFCSFFLKNRRGQVTLFVILAIIILAAVAGFLIYKSTLPPVVQIPSEFQPIYNTFLSCVQSTTLSGISILESQGGYIYLPAFQQGSSYMPFSSQLNFLGNPIPYWYYVSGNNIATQQVPSESGMEAQLAQFINQNIRNCNLAQYTDEGYVVQMGQPSASVSIKSGTVDVDLAMNMNISKGNSSIFVSNHNSNVNSELGNLYSDAQTVYQYEQSNMFLENYTLDTIRNYAPVDGVDIKCSPEVWNAYDIVANLSQAIQDNIMSLHTGNNATDYFSLKIPVQNVRFLTSSGWPSDYEINPSEGSLLVAQPIGNQQGLGLLGFCYVPYHFVYDVKYPVLVTLQRGSEIFQFPFAVVIQGNEPRTSLVGNATSVSAPVLCQNENTNMTVSVQDSNSNPVDANISYECFGETCSIGETASGSINALFPQCVNGYVLASAPGFVTGKYQLTTTQSGSISVVLNKLYNESVDLQIDGKEYTGNMALITFTSSDGSSQTINYPAQKSIGLSEGDYTIQVSAYDNSSINLGATTGQQCINVAGNAAEGALGVTQQQCFSVNVPSQVISSALSGGGQTETYIFESDLQNSNTIRINAQSLPAPTTIVQLQNNYVLLENKTVSVNFA